MTKNDLAIAFTECASDAAKAAHEETMRSCRAAWSGVDAADELAKAAEWNTDEAKIWGLAWEASKLSNKAACWAEAAAEAWVEVARAAKSASRKAPECP